MMIACSPSGMTSRRPPSRGTEKSARLDVNTGPRGPMSIAATVSPSLKYSVDRLDTPEPAKTL